jgi:phospholipase C
MKRVLRAAAAACALAALAASASSAQAATGPCGTSTSASPTYSHVIWIWEENHSYGDIVGNAAQAPYINSLISECGLATNYHNVDHPSLPNYVGATSGLSYSDLKWAKSDCSPTKKCSTSAPSIFGQTPSWKAYEESMPSNCFAKNSGEYAVRHNPAPYYTTLTDCATKDVPYTQLAGDLSSGNLPAFSFITPNLIDDMHDGTIQQGDQWLQANLPTILNSPEYQSGSTVVFITWDEGEGGKVNDCSTNTTDIGCHVATIVISPTTVPGTQDGTLYNHYSLLGTTEQLLGLPLLGQAAFANTMQNGFGL